MKIACLSSSVWDSLKSRKQELSFECKQSASNVIIIRGILMKNYPSN